MKTSLAPGSQVVAEYLEKSGLQKELEDLVARSQDIMYPQK